MIVDEIEAWERKERGKKLTWAILERVFPFTRQTMYSKKEIRASYKKARISLKDGILKPKRNSLSENNNDLVIQKLKNRIKDLEFQIEEFQKLWFELNVKN